MGKDVYANANAIAAKVGGGKLIAAFPDVCMSPPPPPAGPVPIPYPNTSFSKDLKKGSKKVKIGGKPLALKDSFYKTSPLGNEAATKSFGASILSHQTSGKTQFVAYSFDVKAEGKNVCRHIDLATSNHGSYPGSTPPWPNLEAMAIAIAAAEQAIKDDLCACCKKAKHAQAGEPMNMEEWYLAHNTGEAKQAEVKSLLASCTPGGRRKAGCSCRKLRKKGDKPQELLPKPPCDVFYSKSPEDPNRSKRCAVAYEKTKHIFIELEGIPTKKSQRRRGIDPDTASAQSDRQINHLTPKSAGGCPGQPTKGKKNQGWGNLQANCELCSVCKKLDAAFSQYQ